jgi:peroxiredoxin
MNFHLNYFNAKIRKSQNMKLVLTAILNVFYSTVVYGQKERSISIIIKIKDLHNGVKYYLNSESAPGIDSCLLKGGKLKFRYKGEPNILFLATTKDNGHKEEDISIHFAVDQKDVNIYGLVDRFTVDGSVLNDSLKQLATFIKPIQAKKNNLLMTSNMSISEIQSGLDSLEMVLKRIYLSSIQNNTNSYLGLLLLYQQTLTKKLGLNESATLFDKMSPRLKISKLGLLINTILSNANLIKLGKLAPNFTLNNTEGLPVTLSNFKAKYVLLEFWSSWCGPCRSDNPYLVQIYNKFKDKGFEILGIALDNNKETWKGAIKKDNLPWIQLSDLKGWRSDVSAMYQIGSVPSNFLLDPEGRVIANHLGLDVLEEKLTQLFDRYKTVNPTLSILDNKM